MLKQKLNHSLKRKAVDDIASRPLKIIHRELRDCAPLDLTMQDIHCFRKNMNRARLSSYPKLPQSADDFHNALDVMDINTNMGEHFLHVNNQNEKIVCFTTKNNLEALCQISLVFVDGTFYSSPKHFCQLFTLHGLHNNVYVPLVFFLLPNKTQESYEKAFMYVVDICKKFNLCFNPKVVFADFELAIHLALRKVLTNTNIAGCRFHLGQSWYRKIQELGLSNEYKNSDSEIGNFLKLFFGLPFLPPSEVDECFTDDLMSILPQDSRLERFCDYFLKTYLEPSSNFPPQIWSKFSISCIRTTNSCESFHSKFNAMFYTSNPNLYQFVEALKNVQCEVYLKLRSKGITSKETKQKEEFLQEKMILYTNNKLSRIEFVKAVSKKFMPKSII